MLVQNFTLNASVFSPVIWFLIIQLFGSSLANEQHEGKTITHLRTSNGSWILHFLHNLTMLSSSLTREFLSSPMKELETFMNLFDDLVQILLWIHLMQLRQHHCSVDLPFHFLHSFRSWLVHSETYPFFPSYGLHTSEILHGSFHQIEILIFKMDLADTNRPTKRINFLFQCIEYNPFKVIEVVINQTQLRWVQVIVATVWQNLQRNGNFWLEFNYPKCYHLSTRNQSIDLHAIKDIINKLQHQSSENFTTPRRGRRNCSGLRFWSPHISMSWGPLQELIIAVLRFHRLKIELLQTKQPNR